VNLQVVAIAASAGGLEALSELLAAVPGDSGMAYIIVQHLDPGHESLLTEILSRRTSLPVQEAQEGLRVKADHVYVIPPNSALTLADDHLHLSPRAGGRERHRPADILFRSVAEACGDEAIGVVLSGGDADGTLGVQAIKHRGGITFAQDPGSARFQGMPRHAIDSGYVDFVLRPSQIPGELVRLRNHPYLRGSLSPVNASAEDADAAGEEAALRRVFRRLRTIHGVDFAHYKRSTIRRRLSRRMAVQRLEDPEAYAALVESDPAEAAALYQDFLIRVTGFFRDPESFDALAQQVFPSICEGRSPKDPIRIWVPGCASGEETYSIAIALMEYLGERAAPAGVQIFGTDVSEPAIEKARAGIYPVSIAEDVSPERLTRFFVKQDDHYRIAKSIRDLCIFARQDLTRDPPFSRLDLVSCRNLLIYLDVPAQRRVVQVFHYALRSHGFLLLGPSESVGQSADLFEFTEKTHRLYVRKRAPGAEPAAARAGARSTATGDTEVAGTPEFDTALRQAEHLLLLRYAPAGVLVDDELNVLHFHGDTGPYLEHVAGPSSLNLRRLAAPQLLMEIDPALREARDKGTEVRREGFSVGALREVGIQVIPLRGSEAERCHLILFDDASRRHAARRPQAPPLSTLPESEKDRRLLQAEHEVAAMRDYLQATMAEHEAVQEELKAAHEEVLSANEELQSTNEELETSKEELQSSNEELTTTNEELRDRNRELAVLNAELEHVRATADRARAYADEIIETVREPLLVLDADLRILRANYAFYSTFRLSRANTEGRPLRELGTGEWDAALLRAGLEGVLVGEPLNNREITCTLPWLGPRQMSLNARRIAGDADRVELILLAIEDSTDDHAHADDLREVSRRKDEFLAMLAHELRNPLSPLTHTLHLLRARGADAETMQAYDLMERQLRRLVRLVDELLDVARISRGLILLKREPVDLGVLVNQAAEASRTRIEEREHQISLVLPQEPVCVNGDPVRLEQVVSNLLENAVKYTPPGGRIVVTVGQERDEEAVLSVQDSGIGLAPGMQERIFELFAQVDTAFSRAGGGLGLGLTVVRRILALHGGRIEARSAGLGRGSEFIVRLPLLHPTGASLRRSAAPAPASAPAASRTRRVLIVDDNSDAAESLALVARSWGHQVAVAKDATAAIDLARAFRPETALLDIGLPGMNGHELARHLRADPAHRDLFLIAMTGYGQADDREVAREAGFDVHLVKPADLDELKELLATGDTAAA
jgi:two-component system CheB/CheR fusion protein